MGGRGSSSGVSAKGKAYGTEYETLHETGNIKYIKYNDTKSSKTPMETMTKGRIYVTVNEKNQLKAITAYDKENKRYKQIDISGNPHVIDGKKELPHTHMGYFHDENGTRKPTANERRMIDKVKKEWYRKSNKE